VVAEHDGVHAVVSEDERIFLGLDVPFPNHQRGDMMTSAMTDDAQVPQGEPIGPVPGPPLVECPPAAQGEKFQPTICESAEERRWSALYARLDAIQQGQLGVTPRVPTHQRERGLASFPEDDMPKTPLASTAPPSTPATLLRDNTMMVEVLEADIRGLGRRLIGTEFPRSGDEAQPPIDEPNIEDVGSLAVLRFFVDRNCAALRRLKSLVLELNESISDLE